MSLSTVYRRENDLRKCSHYLLYLRQDFDPSVNFLAASNPHLSSFPSSAHYDPNLSASFTFRSYGEKVCMQVTCHGFEFDLFSGFIGCMFPVCSTGQR
jgi:hypothetical protein